MDTMGFMLAVPGYIMNFSGLANTLIYKEKRSKYYIRTDLTFAFACSALLDSSLKYSYWKEDEIWEASDVKKQVEQCEVAFLKFLKDVYIEEEKKLIDARLERGGEPSTETSPTDDRSSQEISSSQQTTTYIRMKGINKRRAARYPQEQSQHHKEVDNVELRAAKRRDLVDDNELFKNCSFFVRRKMLENQEIELYLKQNDDDHYRLFGIAYVESTGMLYNATSR